MISKRELDNQFRNHAQDNFLECEVLGDGNVNAEVLIIGEGPGESEVRNHAPFIGGAGRMLWDGLRPHGLHRANVYVTNVVKRQISLSRFGNERHAVDRNELNKWSGLLRWEVQQLPNVRVILLLGNYAMEAVLGYSGVTNWRGSVIDAKLPNTNMGKIVVTINPAYALRDRKMEPMFLMDCDRLSRVLQNTYKEHTVDGIINPSYPEALSFIRDLKRANKPISYDIEVLNGETACHGLANDPHFGMCINLRDHVHNRYSATQECEIMYALQDLFNHCTHKGIDLIAQNGMFDSYWTWYRDRLRFICSFDTLLAHHLLYPQWPHRLAFLTTQYTTHPFYKDEGRKWREGGDIDDFWRYNIKDAVLTLAVYQREVKELEKRNLTTFFYDHIMRLQPHCVQATVHGVAVDMEAKEDAIASSLATLSTHKRTVYNLIHAATGIENYYPNLESWQQLHELFFRKLSMKGKGESTDKHNRERIKKNPDTPPIQKELLIAFDRYQTESKFHSTFASALVDTDERFRFEFKQYGVVKAPGRLSSKQILNGIGGNIQNQPPRARNMYVADPDCCFIYFDLAQAEARVVAYRANIEKWKGQFEKARLDGKYDCHRALAADMFRIPYDDVPTKDFIDEDGIPVMTKRYVAKRCRHGLNYRMESAKLSEVTGLGYHEAKQAYHLYHKETPELKKWWAQEEAEFRRTKVSYNAFGRPLKIIQRIDDAVLESIVAFYPQSTIGDKVCQVWYQAAEDDKWPKGRCRIAMNIHDSLVGICSLVRAQDALTALSILKKYAEQPIMVQDAWHNKPEKLIVPAETKMSVPDEHGLHRWSNLKAVDIS